MGAFINVFVQYFISPFINILFVNKDVEVQPSGFF